MSAYGTYDRMARYSDFSEMEYTPEIGSALDIYAEEAVSADETGSVMHIHSDNAKIKQILSDLFYDTLNVEFNMTSWARNLVKYGDFFLFNDVSPDQGVINAYPLPISEVEREEGYDPRDPMAVRFRWVTQGNQVLENWQISHMRLLGNDAFLPYGSSVLEPARRIWRQLILLEDAMLVYRIVRAPERRVFKIDVGNVPPEEIPMYMERAQSSLKRAPITDNKTGKVDLRYNPLSVDEDYFIPVRGSESGTDIVTLAGGTIAGEVNDVEYIQKKLFAALKIPKAYLGYDEGLGAKATLSQEDIRFSRTIARVQRTILSEMNKVAIIHLYCHGFTDTDLLDFSLKLSNPSTIAQQQKLELFRTRFEAATTALQTPGLVDKNWVQKNILRLNDQEILEIKSGQKRDKMHELDIESTQMVNPEGPESPQAGEDQGAQAAIDLGLPPEDAEPISENDSVDDVSVPIRIQSKINDVTSMLNEADDDDDDDDDASELSEFEIARRESLKSYKEKRRKAQRTDRSNLAHDMSSTYQRTRRQNDVSGLPREKDDLMSLGKLKLEDLEIDEYLDNKIVQNAQINDSIRSTLSSLDANYGKPKTFTGIISENNSSEEADETD
tara:strand:- start:783 stop:2618 length:1836 start_codon:yes stop_codon:yes gene_type:complete